METAPLKSFATWARTALIREVSARISVVLASKELRQEQPNAVSALEKAVNAAGGSDKGRDTVADKVAYTWFNRIIALRFMDANGYTGIGVVSPERGREGGQPEVLAEAKRGNIDSAVVTSKRTAETVTSLLNGTRRSDDPQGEAYALLLAEYCRHWNRSMPFMFEREGDYTELLIPANLLANDSVLARAGSVLTEEVCQDVEVIGWLYQFYISERKDEVFAGFKKNKKAGAAEIPAATQLFTPHWIVRYLVENSLGRLWLLNRPASRLADQMDYYIAPVDEEADYLKVAGPEGLKVIDPACGSGHMLTYAFDLLYAIYEEEGYAPTDIPGLILANNLYGIEIDPRAGSLAAFALTMKARARQRTFFSKSVKPSVCVLEPITFSRTELDSLTVKSTDPYQAATFWNQFRNADTLGSMIPSSGPLVGQMQALLGDLDLGQDLLTQGLTMRAEKVLEQADMLTRRYSVLVANPPYMGSRSMSSSLSEFVASNLASGKYGLDTAFIIRGLDLVVSGGFAGMITMQSWMFKSSYERLRSEILGSTSIETLAHLGSGAFEGINGQVVSTAAFVLRRGPSDSPGVFIGLAPEKTSLEKASVLRAVCLGTNSERSHFARASDFFSVPGAPIAYWLNSRSRNLYANGSTLAKFADVKKGIDTGNNSQFLRKWFEVSRATLAAGQEDVNVRGKRWVTYNKGGPFRRWYGNDDDVVDWGLNGARIRAQAAAATARSTIRNPTYFYREGFTYSEASFGRFSARYTPGGAIFDSAGATVFAPWNLPRIGALINSAVAEAFFDFLCNGNHFQPGAVSKLLLLPEVFALDLHSEECVEISKRDWDNQETSRSFRSSPLLASGESIISHAVAFESQRGESAARRMAEMETANNHKLAAAYEMQDTVECLVPIEDISLVANPSRFHADRDQAFRLDALRQVEDLVSFAVGCMFGRFSLDEPGLILADQGDTLQGYLAKVPTPSFMPDKDNVIPIVDGDWFEDDIVSRFRQFLRVAFGEQHFEENLRFVTDSLGVKDLRDYFVKSFYGDHVKRYKKRPIYWLFSSPKGSFSALIYMHRYTPSTVSTVLNEYLREFKAKLTASREHHERLAAGTGTPRQQAAAQKEVDRLRKVLLELEEYEHDVLYPLATQQVQIDLDDGVKANYPKLGAALKKIPGLEAIDE
ncbi:BREX-1 system adenine-specific DNA-methyltransferase PglX [Arthrobacter sp. TS-15]|uniref:BREX-1 system adenine-specific DNA-methyltransferase PglX n=1 Tax=Arthrobacter sp. TS-15 TaxID=2510797 RepID=UPI00115ECB29|nr:BREX-1 system adenine-specific DNA-methyltransferase PglX [Arthrobacter sp. TS-15]TQS94373.1 BREX-1 system adenine-specific DNA-methyltransferase PglX [Arthrobacter sp. TS-15]